MRAGNKSREWKPMIVTDIDEDSNSSLVRAANVLICLGEGINNVTDIADRCKLSKATVHRLLNTLKEPRFTVYDSVNHRYYLGPLITQLASNIRSNHQPLIICAVPEMKRLSTLYQETITLTLMIGLQFIRLHDIRSTYSLRVEEPGDEEELKPLLPFGALQKVMLSQLDERELQTALKSFQVWSKKSQSNFDMQGLLSQLKQIRQKGCAVSMGERVADGVGISAPVKNYICPAAISILGPKSRMRTSVARITEDLKISSERLSNDILTIFNYRKQT